MKKNKNSNKPDTNNKQKSPRKTSGQKPEKIVNLPKRRKQAGQIDLYKTIAESAGDYICLTSMAGEFIFTSPSFKQLGFGEGEIIGKKVFDFLHPDNFEFLNSLQREYIQARNFKSVIEKKLPLKRFIYFRFRMKSGEWREIEANANILSDESGDLISFLFIGRDITELKRAENALTESRNRFNRLVVNVPGVVYQFVLRPDLTYRIPYINERVRDFFELEPDDVTRDPLLLLGRIHPDFRADFYAAARKSSGNLTPFDFTGKIITTKGEKWGWAVARPVRHENGDIVWDGLMIDVTYPRNIEQDLEKSEKRYSRMVTNIPGIVHQFIIHPDYSIEVKYISEGLRELLSLDPADVEKNPRLFVDSIHPEYRRDFITALQKAASALSRLEWEGKGNIPGRELWIRAIGHMERQSDGDILWDGIIIDITGQKNLEKMLRESERDINDWINTFEIFVSKLSPDGIVIFSNETSLNHGGVTLEEVSGVYFPDLKWLSHSQEDRSKIIEALNNAARGISTRKEISFINKDGEPIPLIADIHPVFDRDGKIKYITFEGKSIVEEKRLTEELINAKENLEDKVNERTREITEINKKLVEEIAVRKTAEESLRESEERFRDISFNIGDLIWEVDTRGRVTHISGNSYKLMGYNPEEIISITSDKLTDKKPLSSTEHQQQMMVESFFKKKSVNKKPIYDLETWFTNTRGEKVCLLTNAVPVFDKNGEFAGYRGVSKDITERKKSEEENIRLAALSRESPNPILSSNENGEITYVNPTAQRIIEQLDLNLEKEFLPENHRQLIQYCLETNRSIKQVEIRMKNHVFNWTYNPVKSINIVHLHGIDISDQKRFEEKLLHDAFHDELTGLPNRSLFIDRLSHSIKLARRDKKYLFAVLFLDMDRFKVVNDSLGHIIGDRLLVEISQKLREYIRPGDTIARFGGDEFTLLLDNISGTEDAIRVAKRIQSGLSFPIKMKGHEIFSTVSIGIAMSTTGYLNPEDVLRDADTAMFHAKALGISRYVMFDRAMHTQAMNLLEMESDLQHAVERQEFRLHYQPIISLESLEVIGFEALLRWQHPKRGLVLPGEFIPAIEETGLIVPIGKWILREALSRMKEWNKIPDVKKAMFICVNLSSKQFIQPDFINQIKKILKETGFDPAFLKLEITEGIIIENYELSSSMLEQLRKHRVQLSIDDFGTGYSSLSHLHHFPINTIKIDRSFINEIGTEEGQIEIVHTIITLAHNLHMDVIAEGVETEAQMEFLKKMGCEHGQGLYFSRPLETGEVPEFLKRGIIDKKGNPESK